MELNEENYFTQQATCILCTLLFRRKLISYVRQLLENSSSNTQKMCISFCTIPKLRDLMVNKNNYKRLGDYIQLTDVRNKFLEVDYILVPNDCDILKFENKAIFLDNAFKNIDSQLLSYKELQSLILSKMGQ